jgi:hypothetical protein
MEFHYDQHNDLARYIFSLLGVTLLYSRLGTVS